jgi:hypothetical protein
MPVMSEMLLEVDGGRGQIIEDNSIELLAMYRRKAKDCGK